MKYWIHDPLLMFRVLARIPLRNDPCPAPNPSRSRYAFTFHCAMIDLFLKNRTGFWSSCRDMPEEIYDAMQWGSCIPNTLPYTLRLRVGNMSHGAVFTRQCGAYNKSLVLPVTGWWTALTNHVSHRSDSMLKILVSSTAQK